MRATKVVIVAAICLAASGQLGWAKPTAADEEQSNRAAWLKFKQQFNKTYEAVDDVARFARFVITLGRIAAHNALTNSSFTMGLNKFADYNETELASLLGSMADDDAVEQWRQKADDQRGPGGRAPGAGSLPARVDWRDVQGRVTGVKDQGQCGACWAFATVAMLEGQDTASERDLSAQQILDCSTSNSGCGGGWIAKAIDDIRSQGAGLETSADYPYEDAQSSCRHDRSRAAISKPGQPMMLRKGDEQQLADWVANWGPVAVSFTTTDAFMSYQGGVFADSECQAKKRLTHAVAVVGYGTDQKSGLDYWIIKNQWGAGWGEQGFGRIQRGVNMCNIATSAVVIP